MWKEQIESLLCQCLIKTNNDESLQAQTLYGYILNRLPLNKNQAVILPRIVSNLLKKHEIGHVVKIGHKKQTYIRGAPEAASYRKSTGHTANMITRVIQSVASLVM